LQRREEARLEEENRRVTEGGEEQAEQTSLEAAETVARMIAATEMNFDSSTGYTECILQNIARELETVQGLVFTLNDADQMFHLTGQYAYYSEEQPRSFPSGETLSGQAAKNRKLLNLTELPDGYITILSGLGKSSPQHLLIVPVVHNGGSIGIMELASFKPFGTNEERLIEKVAEAMAEKLNELRK
jgi:putative methionine-R-sulfoxide reductase with GAF domain